MRNHLRSTAVGYLAVLCGLGMAAVATSPALAADPATWHAAPGGAGDLCTEASPCTLERAVETQAQAGDTVLAAPGTYEIADELRLPEDVTLRGDGAATTVIELSSPQISSATASVSAGSTLSDVTLRNCNPHSIGFSAGLGPALVERIVAVPNDGSIGCVIYTKTVLRDSVCIGDRGVVAEGLPPHLVNPGLGAILVNVTAVGTTGPGLEVVNPTSLGGTHTFGSNVIAQSLDGGEDVIAPIREFSSGSTEVYLDHSNYDAASEFVTPPGTNGNQTAAPVFVPDGFHQAPTSPTLDAGDSTAANLGPFDIDGELRVQGESADIGADESVVPPEPIEELRRDVEEAPLPGGIEHALRAKLATAAAALESGDVDEACGALRAFKNQVTAQRGKKISAALADDLLHGATQAMDSIGCRRA